MQAVVTFIQPTTGTVFPQTATGHVITAQTGDPLDGTRIAILTDDRGYRALNRMNAGETSQAKVTDLLTETVHTLARADCGLGCRCACRIVRSKHR